MPPPRPVKAAAEFQAIRLADRPKWVEHLRANFNVKEVNFVGYGLHDLTIIQDGTHRRSGLTDDFLSLSAGSKSKTAYVVSSDLLAAANRAWYQLLHCWAETSGDRSFAIIPQHIWPNIALQLFLEIACGDRKKVPLALDLPFLYGMAKVSYRYNAIEMLAPWVGQWIQDARDTAKNRSGETLAYWIWIAYEFGQPLLLQSICLAVVYKVADPTAVLERVLPDNLNARIVSCRQHYLQQILAGPYGYLRRLRQSLDPDATTISYTICRDASERCIEQQIELLEEWLVSRHLPIDRDFDLERGLGALPLVTAPFHLVTDGAIHEMLRGMSRRRCGLGTVLKAMPKKADGLAHFRDYMAAAGANARPVTTTHLRYVASRKAALERAGPRP